MNKCSIYRRNNHLWIQESSVDQGTMCRSKKYSTCRSKNYLQIKVFDLQIKEMCANRRSIPSADLQIEELSADQRTMCWSNLDPQIEEVFHMEMKEFLQIIEGLKNYLQIKKLSANQKIICRSKNYLQIEEISAYQKNMYRLKTYSICRSKNYLQTGELFYLQIAKLFADWRSIWILKNYAQIEFQSTD